MVFNNISVLKAGSRSADVFSVLIRL